MKRMITRPNDENLNASTVSQGSETRFESFPRMIHAKRHENPDNEHNRQ